MVVILNETNISAVTLPARFGDWFLLSSLKKRLQEILL